MSQTIDQVRAAMGSPERAELGSKVIYYGGTKIVFKNGNVSDIE